MVEENNFTWFNWARNHSCIAENYFEPETESQIIEVVRFAGLHKKRSEWWVLGIPFRQLQLAVRF